MVTPDLKAPGASVLLHVDLGAGRRRLGGSSLAQAYRQVGAARRSMDVRQPYSPAVAQSCCARRGMTVRSVARAG